MKAGKALNEAKVEIRVQYKGEILLSFALLYFVGFISGVKGLPC